MTKHTSRRWGRSTVAGMAALALIGGMPLAVVAQSADAAARSVELQILDRLSWRCRD